MRSWKVRTPKGEVVKEVFYLEDCDEDYVRRAEEIPAAFTMEPDPPLLRSCENTAEVAAEVEELAAWTIKTHGFERVQSDCFYEHGQWWVRLWGGNARDVCDREEITYSVVDTSNGLDLEVVG